MLIPVFDRQKHYWIGEDEIDKLLNHGGSWLEDHPEKVFITRRYFGNLRSLTRIALDRLDNGEGALEEFSIGEAPVDEGSPPFPAEENTEENAEENVEGSTGENVEGSTERDTGAANPAAAGQTKAPNLNTLRLEAALGAIKESGAQSVIYLGCGEGNLLRLLMKEKTFTRITGVDISRTALEHSRSKLKLDYLPEARRKQVSLFQSSVSYRDKRFRGYDAAALVEVIEHLDENRLDALAAVVFGDARPGTVVISTPNIEYNELYGLSRFRHGDHRFEWDRARFRAWAEEISRLYGYTPRFKDIGEADEKMGAPTQMAIFSRLESPGASPCV